MKFIRQNSIPALTIIEVCVATLVTGAVVLASLWGLSWMRTHMTDYLDLSHHSWQVMSEGAIKDMRLDGVQLGELSRWETTHQPILGLDESRTIRNAEYLFYLEEGAETNMTSGTHLLSAQEIMKLDESE